MLNRATAPRKNVGGLAKRAAVGSGSMLRLLRIALQVVLFFLLMSVVIGIGAAETGPVEKGALAVIGLVLVWVASRVRRIGVLRAQRL